MTTSDASDQPIVHTPGPWVWCEHYQGLYAAGEPIIEFSRYEGMWLAYGKHQAANAKLIASAPAMRAEIDYAIDALDPAMARHEIIQLRERLIRLKSSIEVV
jgi:hypothetical protein